MAEPIIIVICGATLAPCEAAGDRAPLEDELTRLGRDLEIERSERVRYALLASKRYDEIKRLTNERDRAEEQRYGLANLYTAEKVETGHLQERLEQALAKVDALERELDEMEDELDEVVELSHQRLNIIQRQQAKVQDLEQALAYTRECYHDLKEREGALANLLDNQAKLFEQMERKLAVERDIAADRKIIIQDLEAKVQELEQALAEMLPDKARLDFLQSITEEAVYTGKVICRWSNDEHGWRLHETSKDGAVDSVREAIDRFREEIT